MLLSLSCSNSSPQQVNGYIEGRYTYIATSVAGQLKVLYVKKGDRVKKDQELFVLEAQPESNDYQIAKENLNKALSAREAIVAKLELSNLNYQRYQTLVAKKAIEQLRLDEEKANRDTLLAQLAEAEREIGAQTAALERAKWVEGQKSVSAPIEGFVFDTYYREGEYTSASQPILSLLAPENIKAIFYIPEQDLAVLKLNQQVQVSCDSCKQSYFGRVSYISPSAEYTPPVIYSAETNEKLVYRIEADFSPTDAIHLHPGQPITIDYGQRHDRAYH